MLLKYSTLIDFFAQDSLCYNGIDIRQVSTMLKILHKIAFDENKQSIVCINKYQIDYHKSENIDFIRKNSAIVLNENDTLLKTKF